MTSRHIAMPFFPFVMHRIMMTTVIAFASLARPDFDAWGRLPFIYNGDGMTDLLCPFHHFRSRLLHRDWFAWLGLNFLRLVLRSCCSSHDLLSPSELKTLVGNSTRYPHYPRASTG